MHKKLDIAKKVKKLLEEKKGNTPLLMSRDARGIEERREKPPARVAKPSVQLRPLSIKDLTIPTSAYELFSIEIAFDSTRNEKVTQLLSLRENPELKLKWTVFRDPYVEEFDWLKRQGLVQIREDPLIYSRELDEGSLVASHIQDYTFSMASHDLKVEKMVQIFVPLLKYVTEKTGEKESDVLYREKDDLLSAKTAEIDELKRQIEDLKKAHKKSDVLYREKDDLLSAKTSEVEDLKRQIKQLITTHKKIKELEGG